jgi:hypothetical protein
LAARLLPRHDFEAADMFGGFFMRSRRRCTDGYGKPMMNQRLPAPDQPTSLPS